MQLPCLIVQTLLNRLLRMPSLLKLLLAVLVVIWLTIPVFRALDDYRANTNRMCYTIDNLFGKVSLHTVDLLEDVYISTRKPTPDKTIFFHVTSCSASGTIEMSSR